MNRTFGLGSASEQLTLLRDQVTALKADDLNAELARQCACTAWALCDWTFRDHGAALGYGNLRSLQDAMKGSCPELGYMQDICTETKHGQITRYTPVVERAERHGSAFSKGFSRAFDVSHLQIVIADKIPLWFVDVAETVVVNWESLYEQHSLRLLKG